MNENNFNNTSKNGSNSNFGNPDILSRSTRTTNSKSPDFFDEDVVNRFRQSNPFGDSDPTQYASNSINSNARQNTQSYSDISSGRSSDMSRTQTVRDTQSDAYNNYRSTNTQINSHSGVRSDFYSSADSYSGNSASRVSQIDRLDRNTDSYHNERPVRPINKKPAKKGINPVLLVLIDIVLTGIALLVFALFHHALPQELDVEGITAQSIPEPIQSQSAIEPSSDISDVSDSESEVSEEVSEPEVIDPNDWGAKFRDKFTDEVVITENSYTSPNVSITVEKYFENDVTYYVQDIYIANIDSFQTALAKDKYGKGYAERVPEIAQRYNAIAAVNGDYYGIGTSGTVIRNGVLYRSDESSGLCVLFRDGTIKIYEKKSYDSEELLNQGAWQAWSFGPTLLDENGKAMTEFDSRLKPKNPRTVLGYYEPGHYCFVLVDGRQEGYSVGMTLKELSVLMEQLGCQAAYNLDGGQSSIMTFMDTTTNQPYDGGRRSSDILLIAEP